MLQLIRPYRSNPCQRKTNLGDPFHRSASLRMASEWLFRASILDLFLYYKTIMWYSFISAITSSKLSPLNYKKGVRVSHTERRNKKNSKNVVHHSSIIISRSPAVGLNDKLRSTEHCGKSTFDSIVCVDLFGNCMVAAGALKQLLAKVANLRALVVIDNLLDRIVNSIQRKFVHVEGLLQVG